MGPPRAVLGRLQGAGLIINLPSCSGAGNRQIWGCLALRPTAPRFRWIKTCDNLADRGLWPFERRGGIAFFLPSRNALFVLRSVPRRSPERDGKLERVEPAMGRNTDAGDEMRTDFGSDEAGAGRAG